MWWVGDVFERYTHDVELDSGCVLFALGEGAQRPIPFDLHSSGLQSSPDSSRRRYHVSAEQFVQGVV